MVFIQLKIEYFYIAHTQSEVQLICFEVFKQLFMLIYTVNDIILNIILEMDNGYFLGNNQLN